MVGLTGKSIIDKMSDRLGRLEVAKNIATSDDAGVPYATAEELEQMTDEERFEAWFNWRVKAIMPYHKEAVMKFHNISDEEYDRRTLEGDESIYLPQPNNKFEPTGYMERVAHVLSLSWQELQEKFKSGELKHLVAAGPNNAETGGWSDEDGHVF